MDISVVIPLFNKKPHVQEAIHSVLNQTLPPREVIVVDDGSTDGGLDIVRAFADPRIIVLQRSPPGPGGYAARNLGIETANGEWIAFLDADDCWKPRHLADMAAACAPHGEDVGGVFSRYVISGGDGDRLNRAAPDLQHGGKVDLDGLLRAWLRTRRCPIWTGASAFRRDVLLKAGLFPAGRARRGGDKDLWLRAAAIAPLAHVSNANAVFRQDTVNRVSTGTGHTDLPIVVQTIRAMMPVMPAVTRQLLRRLSNQEILIYARYASQAGRAVDTSFFRALSYPEGLPHALGIMALRIGRPILGRVHRLLRPAAPVHRTA
ncbi:glycosyltransferase family A protein [Croceibacterium sp. TMG7-5b_MA50]|uniref:glycosyltransferase family 2 protein n=1 Tax=Croceibacterium sp. TMG7-5b_MA50 TaxID=3121290 RepID=UPI0032221E74